MGKKLIIKGADFYANRVTSGILTFYNDYSDQVLEGNSTFNSSAYFYVLPTDIDRIGINGNVVSYVKLIAATSGSIKIATYSGSGSSVSNVGTYSVVQGKNIIRLTTPITVSATSLIAISGNGILRFWWQSQDDTVGWKTSRVGQDPSGYTDLLVPISFGNVE